jgi:hypothetical protein
MTIDISKQARADAVASIQRYFEENMPGTDTDRMNVPACR